MRLTILALLLALATLPAQIVQVPRSVTITSGTISVKAAPPSYPITMVAITETIGKGTASYSIPLIAGKTITLAYSDAGNAASITITATAAFGASYTATFTDSAGKTDTQTGTF